MVEIGAGRRLRAVAEGPPPRPARWSCSRRDRSGSRPTGRRCRRGWRPRGCARWPTTAPASASPTPVPSRATARPSSAISKRCWRALGETGPLHRLRPLDGRHARAPVRRAATPARVRALVLVDATTPEAMDHPLAAQFVGHFASLSKLAAWGAKAGLARPLAGAVRATPSACRRSPRQRSAARSATPGTTAGPPPRSPPGTPSADRGARRRRLRPRAGRSPWC